MRYREFAVEALKPSEYRSLVKGWDKTKYAELFGGQYRIYIPLESAGPDTKQVKVNQQVSQEVEKLGYKIDDYLKGIASKTENGRVRQIKIGKLLSPSTAQVFANDPVRGATRKSTQLVVISRHPYDIAGMSTDRGWRSCMNLDYGQNKHFVPLDIKAGTVVAYLINANDKNINSPQARILIKPFVNILGNHEIALGIEDKAVKYGTASPGFIEAVESWVDKINSSRKLNGIFKLDPGLYNDNFLKAGLNYKFIGNNDTDSSLESHLHAVEVDPTLITKMMDAGIKPHELVQKAAVSKNPKLIANIIDAGIKPSEAVQLAAIKKDPEVFEDILIAGLIPSETVQLAGVENNRRGLRNLVDAGIIPSKEVEWKSGVSLKALVKFMIRHKQNPSEALKQAAGVVNVEELLKSGVKPSEEDMVDYVKSDGNLIKNITNAGIDPPESVQIAAVTESLSAALPWIKNPSPKVIKLSEYMKSMGLDTLPEFLIPDDLK